MLKISDKKFFMRDVLEVAPELVGKTIARRTPEGVTRLLITETEAYRGSEDTACHASRGRTKRTDTMFLEGGAIYIYLCYGIHWMLNIVTGPAEEPQAVLIRACREADGPGKLTKALRIDSAFNRKFIYECKDLWLEDSGVKTEFVTAPRVGINYASPEDIARPWRYILKAK